MSVYRVRPGATPACGVALIPPLYGLRRAYHLSPALLMEPGFDLGACLLSTPLTL
jgi:hypothetical protein